MTKPYISLIPEVNHENPLVFLAFEFELMLRIRISSGNNSGTKTRIYTRFSENILEKFKNPLNDFG